MNPVSWPLAFLALALAALFIGYRKTRRDAQRLGEIRRFADTLGGPDGTPEPLATDGSHHWFNAARALNRLAQTIDERQREERQAYARLEAVLGGLEEGFLVVSTRATVLFANPRMLAFFGSPALVEGRPLSEVVRERRVIAAIEQSLAGQSNQGEIRVGEANPRTLRFRAVPFPAEGPTQGSVALFHDVTELRRAETARRDFLANASHEIKTPLASIRGFAEILADREVGDPTSKRATEAVLDNAKRLTQLVEDLLELARIEGGAQPMHEDRFDARDVTRSIMRDFEPRFWQYHQKTSLEAEGETQVGNDRRAYEQVLTNLIDNAVKYSGDGGEIRVRVAPAEAGDRLRVEVHDTGPGISLRHQARLFERFYRVDPGRSRNLGGTGLGLAIVKHLVQGMGGEVGLESEPPRGSCFWFEIARNLNQSGR